MGGGKNLDEGEFAGLFGLVFPSEAGLWHFELLDKFLVVQGCRRFARGNGSPK